MRACVCVCMLVSLLSCLALGVCRLLLAHGSSCQRIGEHQRCVLRRHCEVASLTVHFADYNIAVGSRNRCKLRSDGFCKYCCCAWVGWFRVWWLRSRNLSSVMYAFELKVGPLCRGVRAEPASEACFYVFLVLVQLSWMLTAAVWHGCFVLETRCESRDSCLSGARLHQ